MNIIQIIADTFRRDYLGFYGNDWIRTENLDRLARDSMVFDRAYVASFATIPCRHDLFTGRYATLIKECTNNTPLPRDEEPILSQLLRQAGYTTMLIADTYHMIRTLPRPGFRRLAVDKKPRTRPTHDLAPERLD